MFKKLKKELQINIDENEGLLYLGDKNKDLKLLMLRPIDIIEFSEFAGTNAEDILVWCGKTIGKQYIEKFFYQKDWSAENIAIKKDVIVGILETYQLCGFGVFLTTFKKDHVKIKIFNPISLEEKNNIMAKILCLFYHGLFNGMFDVLGIEAEGEEIECVLKGNDCCVFKFKFLVDRLDDELVDEDQKPEAVADFLSTL